MKKLMAAAAALLISACAFADGFTNKINLGGVYSNTDLTLKDMNTDFNLAGAGVNLGWRGTFSNGVTLLADMDLIPVDKLSVDNKKDNDYTAVSFTMGAGYEWTFEKGSIALAGVYGDVVAAREDNNIRDTFYTYFVGANIYGSYMFTKNVGLYGACTAGVSVAGEYDVEKGSNVDVKAGDLYISPKAGVVFKF